MGFFPDVNFNENFFSNNSWTKVLTKLEYSSSDDLIRTSKMEARSLISIRPFNDSMILNRIECLSLIEMTKATSSLLLYRASRDGFSYDNFHFNCDNKEKTVILIKNNLNFVFGGYTSETWTSDVTVLRFKTDATAFIFSLRRNGISNSKKFKVKKSEHAIIVSPPFGSTYESNGMEDGRTIFCFGRTNIRICDNSDLNYGNYTNFGGDYELPEGLKIGSLKIQEYLGGSLNVWLSSEIEVYQITH